jgi:hypothetical protein
MSEYGNIQFCFGFDIVPRTFLFLVLSLLFVLSWDKWI